MSNLCRINLDDCRRLRRTRSDWTVIVTVSHEKTLARRLTHNTGSDWSGPTRFIFITRSFYFWPTSVTHTHTHEFTRAHSYLYTHARIYTRTLVFLHLYLRTHTLVFTHTHTLVFLHAHTLVFLHAHGDEKCHAEPSPCVRLSRLLYF